MSEPEPQRFSLLESHANTRPEKLAVVGAKRSLTYHQLTERAQALARRLFALGLRPGDQAAVMTYNLPEYDEISRALEFLRVGMVMVGYRMKPPEIQFIVDDSDSKILFFWHEFADRILPFKDAYENLNRDDFVVFGGSADGARDYEDLFRDPPEVDLQTPLVAGRLVKWVAGPAQPGSGDGPDR